MRGSSAREVRPEAHLGTHRCDRRSPWAGGRRHPVIKVCCAEAWGYEAQLVLVRLWLAVVCALLGVGPRPEPELARWVAVERLGDDRRQGPLCARALET